jgi:prepilin-type N-terminal cleavage/methylation domain-containing protein
MLTIWQCDLCPAQERHRAFTLIEIMIVVGIIAVVLAMGMPGFVQTVRKEPLRKAVSDIVEACSTARAQAILKGVPAEVTIHAADGRITVAQVKTNNVGQAETHAQSTTDLNASEVSAEPIFSARLHVNIAITLLYVNLKDQMEAEQTRVHFYSNGTSDEFTIVLQAGSSIRKISLECVTGLPAVEAIR